MAVVPWQRARGGHRGNAKDSKHYYQHPNQEQRQSRMTHAGRAMQLQRHKDQSPCFLLRLHMYTSIYPTLPIACATWRRLETVKKVMRLREIRVVLLGLSAGGTLRAKNVKSHFEHVATMATTAPAVAASKTALLPKFRYLSAWFCPFAHRTTLALEHHADRVDYEWVEVSCCLFLSRVVPCRHCSLCSDSASTHAPPTLGITQIIGARVGTKKR